MPQAEAEPGHQRIPINSYESSEALVVIAPMPGVRSEDVSVIVTPDELILRAELRTSAPKTYMHHEWEYGLYERRIALDDDYGGPVAATLGHGQLAVRIVQQGVVSKTSAFDQILSDSELSEEAVSYMGDDLLDLPVLKRCGLSAAPADAVAEVRSAVHCVTVAGGGRGAVRELIEMVLRAQGRWSDVVAEYGGQR